MNDPSTRPPADKFAATDALVGIIMGSRNDWPTMKAAAEILRELQVSFESMVVSAHRTPQRMAAYAESAAGRGLKVIIAGAGGAAHLPGMVASETHLPVIGVPVQSRALQGLDSLLSIVQMPGGIPVATMSIGTSGAKNAGLMAARILALSDAALRDRLQDFITRQTNAVLESADLELED
ncbi:5-(carboxyamino)imidazole ribonucleotide mutase [Stieleria varia]|uniref:N5-carboxyaminoimidazole ribonucleotide mutase n=2 Tax=Stieleria varia TaxID=2528005 RepID=A0A5C6A5C4_9BACT|nr:5-(carboxyamino)imidazole ribonucleotide mutase [Stieleria varia]TWT94585.1 N5-carboxyaminoimidazole ribonucleotide mutase [Stieleria varia]